MIWLGLVLGGALCVGAKVAGMAVPATAFSDRRVQRIVATLPIGLLAALVALQTLSAGHHLVVDARAGGLAVAAVALWRRAPFLVVVGLAAATAALLRWMT